MGLHSERCGDRDLEDATGGTATAIKMVQMAFDCWASGAGGRHPYGMQARRDRARSYRDLVVWQCSRDLASAVYRLTRELPADERFRLVDQIRRAAVSVSSNIAEGWGRGTRGELHRFAGIARGSLLEVESLLNIAEHVLDLKPTGVTECRALAGRCSYYLNRLRSSLRANRRSGVTGS